MSCSFADPDRGIALGPAPIVALERHSRGGHAVLATLFPSDVISAQAANDADAVGALLDAEDPCDRVMEVPILVVHGRDDPLLPPEGTEALVERIAAGGSLIQWPLIEGGDHGMRPWTARDEVVGFWRGACELSGLRCRPR